MVKDRYKEKKEKTQPFINIVEKTLDEKIKELLDHQFPSYTRECPALLLENHSSMKEIINELQGTGKYASREKAAIKAKDKKSSIFNEQEKLSKIDGLISLLQRDIPIIKDKCNPGKLGLKELQSAEKLSLQLRNSIDKEDLEESINITNSIYKE